MTIPFDTHHFMASIGYPPSHPSPHENPQQARMSSAESMMGVLGESMQVRSEAISAAAKAQHDPQSDWSRIQLIE